MSRISSKGVRMHCSFWMSRELLTKLKCKKDVYQRWKQDQVIQEE